MLSTVLGQGFSSLLALRLKESTFSRSRFKNVGSDRQKIPAPAAIKNSRLQAASAPQHCLIVNNI